MMVLSPDMAGKMPMSDILLRKAWSVTCVCAEYSVKMNAIVYMNILFIVVICFTMHDVIPNISNKAFY